MSNLADFLNRSARVYPEQTALVSGQHRLSYKELGNCAARVAGMLREMGIGQGDRVAMSCPNIPQFVMVYFGILSAGAIVVPLNILLKPQEVTYHLRDSGACVFFCFEGSDELPMGEYGLEAFNNSPDCRHFIAITVDKESGSWRGNPTLSGLFKSGAVAGAEPLTADTTAAILYSSGTTGEPKGAELSHHNLAMNALACQGAQRTDSHDIQLAVLPLFHTFAQTVQMLQSVVSASTLVLQPRFEARRVLETLAEHKVTFFAGVPTMFIGLNLAAEQVSEDCRQRISDNLRLCVSGGGPLPVEVLRQFEQSFRVTVLEGYGLSETSPVACFNSMDKERIPGSIGRPICGVLMKIVDEDRHEVPPGNDGELAIKGHNVMKGYFGRPEQTARALEDGWFFTGDVARCDQAGNYYIVDRLKDMIVRGGFNVYPREVEEVLLTHPDIALAAVIGVPDDYYVEEIMACLVLGDGAQLTPEAVKTWARQQLGEHKYPRHIRIFDQLPLTSTGKILKRELRTLMAEETG